MREGLLMMQLVVAGRVDEGLAAKAAAEQFFGWVDMLEGELDGVMLRAKLAGLDAAERQAIVDGVLLAGWRMGQANHALPFEVGGASVLMQLSDDVPGTYEVSTWHQQGGTTVMLNGFLPSSWVADLLIFGREASRAYMPAAGREQL